MKVLLVVNDMSWLENYITSLYTPFAKKRLFYSFLLNPWQPVHVSEHLVQVSFTFILLYGKKGFFFCCPPIHSFIYMRCPVRRNRRDLCLLREDYTVQLVWVSKHRPFGLVWFFPALRDPLVSVVVSVHMLNHTDWFVSDEASLHPRDEASPVKE